MKSKSFLLLSVFFLFSVLCMAQEIVSVEEDSAAIYSDDMVDDLGKPIVKVDYSDFRIAVGGGYTYRWGEQKKFLYQGFNDVIHDMKHGANIDADLQYFFRKSFGLGVNLNYARMDASAHVIELDRLTKINASDSYFYLAPSFIIRKETDNFLFLTSFGVGTLFYDTTLDENGSEHEDYENCYGIHGGFAAEYKISQNMGAGLKLSCMISNTTTRTSSWNMTFTDDPSKINYTSKIEDRPSFFSNIMITGFLSFRTW